MFRIPFVSSKALSSFRVVFIAQVKKIRFGSGMCITFNFDKVIPMHNYIFINKLELCLG